MTPRQVDPLPYGVGEAVLHKRELLVDFFLPKRPVKRRVTGAALTGPSRHRPDRLDIKIRLLIQIEVNGPILKQSQRLVAVRAGRILCEIISQGVKITPQNKPNAGTKDRTIMKGEIDVMKVERALFP